MSAMQKVTGFVQDTSKCLYYHWWQPVYYLDHNAAYPSQSREKLGRWCGWADDHGDILTYWILTDDTKQLIPASDIRPAHSRPNQRAQTENSSSPLPGEPDNPSSSNLGPDTAPIINTTENLPLELQFDDSRENFVPEPHHGETSPSTFIYSWNKDICKVDKPEDLPRFSPSELIGRTFLYEMENEEKLRAEVARKLNDWDSQNHQNIKF